MCLRTQKDLQGFSKTQRIDRTSTIKKQPRKRQKSSNYQIKEIVLSEGEQILKQVNKYELIVVKKLMVEIPYYLLKTRKS